MFFSGGNNDILVSKEQEEDQEKEEEEEEWEEYRPELYSPKRVRSKKTKLPVYELTLDLPQLRLQNSQVQLHVFHGARYFFLKDVEKVCSCSRKSSRLYQEQNINVVMAKSLASGNTSRQLLNIDNVKIFLEKFSKWSSQDCAQVIGQLTHNLATMQQQQQLQQQQEETLTNFLEEMRELVERAVANIGPATMVLHKRTPEFKEASRAEAVKEGKRLASAAKAKIEARIEADLKADLEKEKEKINGEELKKYREQKEKEFADRNKAVNATRELRAMKSVFTSADYDRNPDEDEIIQINLVDEIYPTNKNKRFRE